MKYGADKDVKLYYTISEVVDMTGVPAHILRYWEQDFVMLRPRKNRAGNRSYRDRDIQLIRRIQHLLQVERFTVEGAVKRLKEISWDEPFEPELAKEDCANISEIPMPMAGVPVMEIEPAATNVQVASPTDVPDTEDTSGIRSSSERKTEILTQLREIHEMLRK